MGCEWSQSRHQSKRAKHYQYAHGDVSKLTGTENVSDSCWYCLSQSTPLSAVDRMLTLLLIVCFRCQLLQAVLHGSRRFKQAPRQNSRTVLSSSSSIRQHSRLPPLQSPSWTRRTSCSLAFKAKQESNCRGKARLQSVAAIMTVWWQVLHTWLMASHRAFLYAIKHSALPEVWQTLDDVRTAVPGAKPAACMAPESSWELKVVWT